MAVLRGWVQRKELLLFGSFLAPRPLPSSAATQGHRKSIQSNGPVRYRDIMWATLAGSSTCCAMPCSRIRKPRQFNGWCLVSCSDHEGFQLFPNQLYWSDSNVCAFFITQKERCKLRFA